MRLAKLQGCCSSSPSEKISNEPACLRPARPRVQIFVLVRVDVDHDVVRAQDDEVRLRVEDAAGHRFHDGGFEGAHFDVRPEDNLRHGTVKGTDAR
jgi:hypothetical protein